MLPDSQILNAYKQYKHDTNAVINWLIATGKDYGYGFDEAIPRADGSMGDTNARFIQSKSTARTKVRRVPLSKLNACAEAIAYDHVEMPREIYLSGRAAIRARRETTEWCRLHKTSEEDVKHNLSHSFFSDVLEKMLGYFPTPRAFGRESQPQQQSPGSPDSSKLSNMFDKLELEEPTDDPQHKDAAFISKPMPTDAETENSLFDDANNVDLEAEELGFALEFFFSLMDSFREFIRGLWTDYLKGRQDLITVTNLTEFIIDIMEETDREIGERYDLHGFPAQADKLTAWMKGRPDQDFGSCTAPTEVVWRDFKFRHLRCLFSLQSTIAPLSRALFRIATIWEKIESGVGSIALPSFRPFPSQAPSMDAIFDPEWAEMIFMQSMDIPLMFRFIEGANEPVDSVTRITMGLTNHLLYDREHSPEMVKAQRHVGLSDDDTKSWILFAMQIGLDIAAILSKENVDRAFKDLQYLALSVVEPSLQATTAGLIGPTAESDSALALIARHVKRDCMMEFHEVYAASNSAKGFGIAAANQEAHYFYRTHPLFCGGIATSLLADFAAAETEFGILHASCGVAHLHSTLRSRLGKDLQWKDMDSFIVAHQGDGLLIDLQERNALESFRRSCLMNGGSASSFAANRRGTTTLTLRSNNAKQVQSNCKLLTACSARLKQTVGNEFSMEKMRKTVNSINASNRSSPNHSPNRKSRSDRLETHGQDHLAWLSDVSGVLAEDVSNALFDSGRLDLNCVEILTGIHNVLRNKVEAHWRQNTTGKNLAINDVPVYSTGVLHALAGSGSKSKKLMDHVVAVVQPFIKQHGSDVVDAQAKHLEVLRPAHAGKFRLQLQDASNTSLSASSPKATGKEQPG